MPDPALQPVRVWDLPTRLFHWALALTIVGSVTSAKIGGDAMAWHFRFGFVVFTLLAFRLLWGLVGGHWSRFASFIYAPRTVLRYLRGQARPGEHLDVGHNPLGSLSVLALLAVLAVQVGTGLVADDEIANVGPLNRFVGSAIALGATSWHKQWGQGLILGLVALHIAAILFYLLRRKTNLVRPMVSGDKALPAATPASVDGLAQRLLALALLAVCAGGVAWIVSLGG
ncbi:MAG: cytochrome b/b6 domain-containing protein [Rubrivivax sp.]|nr:cytochrome b/b6 domain-containing protein [Rubrivivax sp.]